jgi:hypothetical protein
MWTSPAPLTTEIPDVADLLRFTSEHGPDILIEAASPHGGIADAGAPAPVRAAGRRIEDALGQVRGVAETLARELKDLDSAPQQVSVEVSVGVTGQADVFVVSASAQAAFKVTLTWTHPGGTE